MRPSLPAVPRRSETRKTASRPRHTVRPDAGRLDDDLSRAFHELLDELTSVERKFLAADPPLTNPTCSTATGCR